ncbi:MAG TPA: DegT/DnrJ/EryC1/StrS aminotransferase family protein [Candidatus Saccharimonadales bacterium]
MNITDEDIAYVCKSLKSDVISGKSSFIDEYERRLADYFGTQYAITCSNGTSAIVMALYVAGVRNGDEVMLPPTAPIMSILPILSLGAKPVFVDLKSIENFDISIDDISKKITHLTKVLLNVPMWGYPNNSNELKDFCQARGITLIEDLSHCHGSKLADGKIMGSSGHISIFSTHERKMITTGEGGFILTDDEDMRRALVGYRSFGVGTSYEYGVEFGLNYRLCGINGALGITQLSKLDDKIETRTSNAQRIIKMIKLPSLSYEVKVAGISNYYSLAVVLDDSIINVSALADYLNLHSIVSDTYAYNYKPLYEMPLFNEFKVKCEVAERLISSIITLPTHEGLSEDDLSYIADTFNEGLIKQGV